MGSGTNLKGHINNRKNDGVVLPGSITVEFEEYNVPESGPGQVVLKMNASSICGSDISAIYREYLGKGPEAYQGVIAGHEPCGPLVEVGSGVKRFKAHLRLRCVSRLPDGIYDKLQSVSSRIRVAT